MKTKIITIFTLLVIQFFSLAQTPGWLWAKNYGTISFYNYIGQNVTNDASGNVILAGHYFGANITFGTHTLTNSSMQQYFSDAFLVKKDGAGNVIWAKSFGCSGNDAIYGVCTDTNDNIFITGTFIGASGGAVGMVLGTYTLNFLGSGGDLFLAKIDPNGNVLWVNSVGGFYSDDGRAICTDASGNVFVAGASSNQQIIIGTTTFSNNGAGDFFIAKYSPTGNLLWAKQGGSAFFDFANSIVSDGAGNIIVCGEFRGPALVLGTQTLTNTNSAGNSAESFIAKYDANGTVVWATTIAGAANDVIRSVNMDVNGNILVTGYFTSPMLACGTNTLINAGGQDLFIAKYSSAGNCLWAKSEGGSASDDSYSVCSDLAGNVYIAGGFYSPTITVGNTSFTNTNGTYDLLVCQYDPSGNVLWASSGTGNHHEFANSICSDGNGSIYVTGYFFSNSLTIGAHNLVNNSGSDHVFIAKLFVGPPIPTSLNSNNRKPDFKLFPSPASEFILLDLEVMEPVCVQFFDVQSRSVKKLVLNDGISQTKKIDVSDLQSGLYTVTVTSASNSRSSKIYIGK